MTNFHRQNMHKTKPILAVCTEARVRTAWDDVLTIFESFKEIRNSISDENAQFTSLLCPININCATTVK